jgi:hypothetical protein
MDGTWKLEQLKMQGIAMAVKKPAPESGAGI